MKFIPWKIVKKTYTPSDKKLEELAKLLFPPLVLQQELAKDGSTMKFHIDYSVDTNLDAVLMDLQEGHNDPVSQKTINGVIERLQKARRMLDAFAEIDKDAKYIIVQDSPNKNDIEAFDGENNG